MPDRANGQLATKTRKRHEHDYHALWYQLGRYGRQDVHLHPCDRQTCDWSMVGPGPTCDGIRSTHVAKKLGGAWSDRTNEGKPL